MREKLFTAEKLHEECGVFGIWDESNKQVAQEIYYGLLSLQHRGQEAAGIAVCDMSSPKQEFMLHKDMGLVTEVFDKEILAKLQGNVGIGHVRYSTTGDSSLENAQPLACYYLKGTLALVHNGNIVNSQEIKQQLEEEGLTFRATTDSEVILSLIAKMRAKTGSVEEAVERAASYLVGGYALVIMSPRKLVVARDPLGLKPLCLGKTKTGWVVASESCAFSAINADFIRDVRPGEIITISQEGIRCNTNMCEEQQARCMFG